MPKSVPLTKLSLELTNLTGKRAPSYRALYFMIMDGRIPAEQIGGRYSVDVVAAAEALGLTIAPTSVAA